MMLKEDEIRINLIMVVIVKLLTFNEELVSRVWLHDYNKIRGHQQLAFSESKTSHSGCVTQ